MAVTTGNPNTMDAGTTYQSTSDRMKSNSKGWYITLLVALVVIVGALLFAGQRTADVMTPANSVVTPAPPADNTATDSNNGAGSNANP